MSRIPNGHIMTKMKTEKATECIHRMEEMFQTGFRSVMQMVERDKQVIIFYIIKSLYSK